MLVYFVGLGFSSVWAGEIFRVNIPIPDDRIRETVTGTVVDADGNPVEGVQVWQQMDVWQDETVTDAAGRFELNVAIVDLPNSEPNVIHGRVIASSSDGRRGMLRFPDNLTDLTKLKDIRIELKEAQTFDIQVVDHAGQPVPNAAVILAVSSYVLEFGRTDSEGRVQLRAPLEAYVEYLFVDGGDRGVDYMEFDKETRQPVSLLKHDEAGRIVMQLAKVRPLTIRAVDTRGSRVPDARVRFSPKLPGKGRRCFLMHYGELLTDDKGETTIYVPVEIEEGSFLSCNLKEYFRRDPGKIDLASQTEAITYILEKRVLLSGKVLLADGSPAEGYFVRINGRGYTSPEFDAEYGPGFRSAKTDHHRHFESLVRPERCFSIQAHKDEVRSSVVHQIVRDTAVEDITLTIKPMMTVSGEVLDYRGKKVNYGTVTLEPIFDNAPQSVPPASVLAAPLSDEQKELPPLQYPKITYNARVKYGKYETSVPAGRYAITRSDCFVEGGYVEVLPGEPATADLVVMVGNTNTLTGRVFPDGFEPIGIKQVTVTAIPDDIFEPRHETISDENGNYSLPLRLVHRWVGAFDRQAKMGNIGRVPAGMPRADIEIGTLGKLSGTLVDADTNKPIAKREICLSVRLERSDGTTFEDFHLWGQTDEQGKFSLPGLVEAYDHRLAIQPAGAKPGDLSTLRRIKLIHKHPGGDVDLGKISDAEAPDALGPRSRFTQPEGAK